MQAIIVIPKGIVVDSPLDGSGGSAAEYQPPPDAEGSKESFAFSVQKWSPHFAAHVANAELFHGGVELPAELAAAVSRGLEPSGDRVIEPLRGGNDE